MYEDLSVRLTIPFLVSGVIAIVYYFTNKVDLNAIFKDKMNLLLQLNRDSRNRKIAALQMSEKDKQRYEKHTREIIQRNLTNPEDAPKCSMLSVNSVPELGSMRNHNIKVYVSQETLKNVYRLYGIPYVFTILFSLTKENKEKDYELTITDSKDVNYVYIEQEINKIFDKYYKSLLKDRKILRLFMKHAENMKDKEVKDE